ncbi:MAG TPA: M15 family metallopeptidase [Marmoricola sp.]|nr:M15 family metallopeptidase [Marmoricola sp.]
MVRRTALVVAALTTVTILAGCGSVASSEDAPTRDTPAPATPSTSSAPVPSTSPAPATSVSSSVPTPMPTVSPPVHTRPARPTPELGTVPPPWLGKRVLPRTADGFGEIRPTPPALRDRRFTLPDRLPMLPGNGFASRVVSPAPQQVLDRSTWAPGCPVGKADLAWVQLAFWGFDGHRHTGELLVNKSAAEGLVQVFGDLYRRHFPIEEMRITRKDEQTAPPTGDGNDTGAFNCRPVRGATSYSQHAYGLAVDVNPFQNPYTKGDVVLPELASAYLDRDRRAPGIIHADGPVVQAFARIGWGWGGSWHSLKDFQHFSANGT